jgi:hypothetical protein
MRRDDGRLPSFLLGGVVVEKDGEVDIVGRMTVGGQQMNGFAAALHPVLRMF